MADDDKQVYPGLVIYKSNGITKTLKRYGQKLEVRQRYDAIPGEPDRVIRISLDQLYDFLRSEGIQE
jgi:hypothetical protein